MSEWYKDWFGDDDYLNVYNHRDTNDAKLLVDTVSRNISLSPGAFVLDAACGTGRHSVLLSELGYKVVGFDLSKKLLSIAEQERKKLGKDILYINSDLRQIYFNKQFELVFNVFTSFGYFEKDEENFLFVKSSFEFLKSDGYYVLDYLNKEYVTDNLISESNKTVNGISILEKREIKNGRVEKNIYLEVDGKSKRYLESVKLYDKNFIISEFEKIGFKAINVFGDYIGSKFENSTSQRLIIIFQK